MGPPSPLDYYPFLGFFLFPSYPPPGGIPSGGSRVLAESVDSDRWKRMFSEPASSGLQMCLHQGVGRIQKPAEQNLRGLLGPDVAGRRCLVGDRFRDLRPK